MPIDPSILNEVEHLRELKDDEKASLAAKIDLLKFRPQESIFAYGDAGHALFIIRSGEVEIFVKNDNGEKIVLETSTAGDVFGEVSLLDDGPRTASALAIGAVQALRLDRRHFEEYVRQYPPAALNLLSVAARRLRRSDELIRRTIARNANDVSESRGTPFTRFADAVPGVTGSLPSMFSHVLVFSAWMAVNAAVIGNWKAFDPYPFGFLSVLLCVESIFLTLFVLSSQNRQHARDQIRSDIEFETSLNTEMKIAHLHEKIDKLTEGQYQLAVNVQKLVKREPGS